MMRSGFEGVSGAEGGTVGFRPGARDIQVSEIVKRRDALGCNLQNWSSRFSVRFVEFVASACLELRSSVAARLMAGSMLTYSTLMSANEGTETQARYSRFGC